MRYRELCLLATFLYKYNILSAKFPFHIKYQNCRQQLSLLINPLSLVITVNTFNVNLTLDLKLCSMKEV